ncbi:hypothetical protein, partial [Campylobacter jejuni]|uniref:hypothetical protein n=1 Tax=Campylobacter jejuni TaxID=197 RepID=UPI001E2AF557
LYSIVEQETFDEATHSRATDHTAHSPAVGPQTSTAVPSDAKQQLHGDNLVSPPTNTEIGMEDTWNNTSRYMSILYY